MNNFLCSIENLKKSGIKKLVDARMREFKALGKKSSNEIFKELCFCILTANFNAERSIFIQKEIGNGFLTLPEKTLAKKLKKLGYRYPNTRAKYISEARKCKDTLKKTLTSFKNENEIREWLVKNIKGFGYKEASHFLRNISYKNFAIIDFHIVDLLAKNNLIEKPKNKCLNRIKYLEIEKLLEKIAKKSKLTLAELDLYLWCLETAKVLK